MAQVRLKQKFDAERWITTNTAEIVDWVRRGGTASIRWYPFYEDGNRIEIPRWMAIPEHLVVAYKGGTIAVAPGSWIIRDEKGRYSAISDAEFRSDFEPVP